MYDAHFNLLGTTIAETFPTDAKMTITIIETGIPPESVMARCGQTASWFLDALAAIGKKANILRPYLGEKLPDPTSVTAAIITGSWSMVTDREDWSEKTAGWIRKAMPFDIPLFGVCYGHQLMAHALGGTVGDNPYGGEAGIVNIELTPDGRRNLLLDNFPESFTACSFHQQSVLKPPADCDVLAVSDKDTHQILRYGTSSFSVQFHPEFTPDIISSACATIDVQPDIPIPLADQKTNWPLKFLHNFCRIADIG